MTSQQKRQAAMNLLVLRRWGMAEPPYKLPADLNELRLRHLEKLRAVMADLYSECFSEQQLKALLDFYGTEMGKSILDTESEVASRFQERLRDLAPQLNDEASKGSNSALGASFANPFLPR
jgi:hypothetical protein